MALTVSVTKRLHRFELNTDFSCQDGELTAIVGPSGAGKTTLLRLIAGLERPDQGIVALDGTVWTDTSRRTFVPIHRRRIGLVFQEFTLFPHLNVRKNIAYGVREPVDLDGLMDTFGIRHLADRRPDSISGGERQRAAFCQALASRPHLLLLDEPFSALDAPTRSALCGLLEDLKSSLGIPILHVTHDLAEAKRLGDTIIAVDQGRLNADWYREQMLAPLAEAAAMATHP